MREKKNKKLKESRKNYDARRKKTKTPNQQKEGG